MDRGVSGHKRRVMFVVAGLGAGGAERVISLMASAWVADGQDVTIVAFDHPSAPVFHDFDRRIALVRLGPARGGGGRLTTTANRIWKLRAVIRAVGPDVVISFLTKINVVALLATVGTRVPVIVSERNNPLMQKASRGWNVALARLYPRAAAVVMQTRASLVCLPAAVRGTAKVIPNPIAPARPVPARSAPAIFSGGVLVAAGRLTHQKGFDMLIDAFAQACGPHPHWQLQIWGEGPLRQALEDRVANLGLADRIVLPGNSRRPGGWLEGAMAMVLSSRYEGFPNVLGEAMADGLPVVAFDCAFGPGEMIEDAVTGLLVPAGDVAALAGALERIMADARLRERLGKAAVAAVSRYRPSEILSEWSMTVDRCLAVRERSARSGSLATDRTA